MRKFVILALLASLFSYSVAQSCSLLNSCSECTASPGCGWCAPTQSCMAGDASGPNSPNKCLGQNWEWGSCTQCSSFKDCRSCNYWDQDCYWCASANQCRPLGVNPDNCLIAHSCPCSTYTNCGECLVDKSCSWCAQPGGGGNCIRPTDPCQGNPYNQTCPCDNNFDCQSCRAQPGCKWCNNPGYCSGVDANNCSISLSCSQFCNNAASGCQACNNVNGCAWCDSNKQCVDPSVSTCLFTHTCDDCSHYSYCDTCVDNQDCLWCEDTGSCQTRKNSPCKFIAHSCAGYCAQFSTCSDCSGTKGCAWCEDSSKCADASSANCLIAHTCTSTPLNPPSPTCGFDAGSFVGGMFLIIGLIVIAVGAYVFYRWRTGKKIAYTELK